MIREGRIEDASQIANLKINNYRKTYKGIFTNEFLERMSFEEEKEKYIKGLEKRKVLVYCDEDKILGYIYYGTRRNYEEIYKEYTGEIQAIYVDINMRNNGIGTKLIKSALNDLIKEHEKVILWCIDENIDSRNFYEKNMFEKFEKVMSNIGDRDLYETAYVFDFNKSDKYKLTRYVSFKEKDDTIALYSNFDLIFLKNETVKWVKDIIVKNFTKNIPVSFLKYLMEKEVIEFA